MNADPATRATGRTARRARMTFELERFDWASPDRIEISGRWRGLDPHLLGVPELVARHGSRTRRLKAVEAAEQPSGDEGSWSAVFEWEAGPAALDAAHLEFPDGKVLELPTLRAGLLRHARQRFARGLRAPAAAGGTGEEGGAGAADKNEGSAASTAKGHEAIPDDKSGGPVSTPDPSPTPLDESLTLRFDIHALRDELDVATEELDRTRDEAARARHDAERAIARRHADAERFHGDLKTMKRLAEEALGREREARHELERALGGATADLAAAREARQRLTDELTAARKGAEGAAELAERLVTAEREAERAQRRERQLRRIVDAVRQQVVDVEDS
jgi:hypothetical protein